MHLDLRPVKERKCAFDFSPRDTNNCVLPKKKPLPRVRFVLSRTYVTRGYRRMGTLTFDVEELTGLVDADAQSGRSIASSSLPSQHSPGNIMQHYSMLALRAVMRV